jgi:flagellar L-ring protein precursor FlgH
MTRIWFITLLILGLVVMVPAREKKRAQSSLEDYLGRVQAKTTQQVETPANGSLWTPHSDIPSMASDHVARKVNDTIVIQIMDETVAEATGAVTTQRDYAANSGIGALPGKLNVGGVNPMLDMTSRESLKGSGQATSHSRLRSNLAGRVVAVLPGGSIVIEASKVVVMNNEKQTVTLRGITRAADIGSENTVQSTRLSDLEIQVNGKGIISDSTRRPHWLLRLLTKFLTF